MNPQEAYRDHYGATALSHFRGRCCCSSAPSALHGSLLKAFQARAAVFAKKLVGSAALRSRVVAALAVATLLNGGVSFAGPVDVLTQHNNNARTGANLSETVLTVSNVTQSHFGKLLSVALDGNSFGQPLYVSAVAIGGRLHPVIYVATEHNSVYAIEAKTGQVFWKVNLGTSISRLEVSAYSHAHMPSYIPPYYDTYPEIGTTSTPVIDLDNKAIFVVAKTKTTSQSGTKYHYMIHALDIADGKERLNGPVEIQGSVDSAGVAATGGGRAIFDPFLNLNRAGLLLSGGRVFVAFASQGDVQDATKRTYHGWIFGFDANNLKSTPWVFCTTPDTEEGGIWQSGGGLAADQDGNIFAITGNGPNTATSFGNSVLKLRTSNGIAVTDWFTPESTDFLNRWDLDLGSSGPILISDNLVKDTIISGSKNGILYVLRQSSLGHAETNSVPNAVQEVRVTPAPTPLPNPPGYKGPPLYHGPNDWRHIHGTPVYWNGPQGPTLYVWPEMSPLTAFPIGKEGLGSAEPSMAMAAMGMPGASLSLSANGKTPGTGILWASRPLANDANRQNVQGILEAFDASAIRGSQPIWTSRQDVGRDDGGFFAKFSPPTIADGRVYLSTFAPETLDRKPIAGKSAHLVIYGSLPAKTLSNITRDQLDDRVVRFFPDSEARATAEPSYALIKPGLGLAPAPARVPVSPDFALSSDQEVATVKVPPGTSLYGTGMVFGPLLRNGSSTFTWKHG